MSVFNSAEPTQETCKPFVLSRKKPTEPVLSLPNGFAAETLPPRTLTAEQETKLADHATNTQEDEEWLSDDRCLLRYLRAARWNSTKAAERIQCTLQWRHERRPHRLDPAYVRPEAETGKLTLNGFDRYGHPVIYLVPNRENTKTSQRQVDHFIFFMERAIAAMPSHVDQMTLVIDFTGTSIFQSPGAGVAREIANTLERHYPERLASAFIIGAPWFFGQVYKLISPFLDEVTQKK
ncbi:CRAL-TRIO domain-containing protein, partial [Syncephalis fuscata]